MKRFLLVLSLAALALSCQPQEPVVTLPDSIDDNLYRFSANANPYEYFHTQETPVPAGFKPFYISHYGRHGSRGDWGNDEYPKVLEMYTKAHEAGVLTEEGERAFDRIQTIYKLHNDMDVRLTPRGVREHRAIAHRMYAKYPGVFRGDKRVRAVSSTSPRCLVSMAAFTGELLSQAPKLDMSWDTGEKLMEYLSNGDYDDVAKDANKIVRAYMETYKKDTTFFAQHVLTDEAAAREAIGCSIGQLQTGTLRFANASGAFDQDETLINLFNVEDLKFFERVNALNIFLRTCNSAEFGDRRMAVPNVGNLVDDFIEKADAAIADGDCAADLRFGHDNQMLAFCSKIGVKGIGERLTWEDAVDWPCWLYAPFACNFQLVFYRDRAGEVLVKCFINERETTLLGLPDGPYYRWEDVKKAWRPE